MQETSKQNNIDNDELHHLFVAYSTAQPRSGASWKKPLAILMTIGSLGLNACGQEAEKVVPKVTSATARALATVAPAVESKVPLVVETTPRATLPTTSPKPLPADVVTARKEALKAINYSNRISDNGVLSPVTPSLVISPTLKPINPTAYTLLPAQSFIDPNRFSAAGIRFSEDGKALLQRYFSCEGPSGTELHFRVQHQFPDGRSVNGDVNMSSFQDCPLQIQAIPLKIQQGGIAEVYNDKSPLMTIITPSFDAYNNLRLEFTQAYNALAPQSTIPSYPVPAPTTMPTPMPTENFDTRFRRVDR